MSTPTYVCAVFVRAVCELSLIFLEFVQRDKYQNTKLTAGGRGEPPGRVARWPLHVPISLQSPLSAPHVYTYKTRLGTLYSSYDVHTT